MLCWGPFVLTTQETELILSYYQIDKLLGLSRMTTLLQKCLSLFSSTMQTLQVVSKLLSINHSVLTPWLSRIWNMCINTKQVCILSAQNRSVFDQNQASLDLSKSKVIAKHCLSTALKSWHHKYMPYSLKFWNPLFLVNRSSNRPL